MFKQKKGFTLVELVVVSLLLSILSLVLYQSLKGIILARERTEHYSKADQTAHFIFSKLETEFSNIAKIPLNSSTSKGSKEYLIGLNKKNAEDDADQITFVSNGSAQQFLSANSNHGVVEIKYYLQETKNPDTEENSAAFIRVESPADVSLDEIIKARTFTFPIAEEIKAINFRYYKNQKWLNEWENAGGELPEAIEVTLKIPGTEAQAEVYRTAFAIKTQ